MWKAAQRAVFVRAFVCLRRLYCPDHHSTVMSLLTRLSAAVVGVAVLVSVCAADVPAPQTQGACTGEKSSGDLI
jgi:hypothetical protein